MTVAAEDTTTITALTGAASLSAALGPASIAVSMGVSLAHNEIGNQVAASIKNADNPVKTTIGGVTVKAVAKVSSFVPTTSGSAGVNFMVSVKG